MPWWYDTASNAWTSALSTATSTTTGSSALFSIFGGSSQTTSVTQPVWYSASNGAVWAAHTGTYTDTADMLYVQLAQQRAQAAYERYNFQIARVGNRQLYTPSAPAIISHEQRLAEDRALYARAVAAHDEQEAARLQRQIAALELANAETRRAVEERRQLAREEHARHESARSRAQELLIEHLNPEQRESFKALGWFVVQGGKSGTKYRITSRGVAGNIEVLDKGGARATHRLCCHATDGGIPNGDQWLAQKIMLELAEDEFLRKANRHAA